MKYKFTLEIETYGKLTKDRTPVAEMANEVAATLYAYLFTGYVQSEEYKITVRKADDDKTRS